jgi:hypothetical protein
VGLRYLSEQNLVGGLDTPVDQILVDLDHLPEARYLVSALICSLAQHPPVWQPMLLLSLSQRPVLAAHIHQRGQPHDVVSACVGVEWDYA